MTLDELDMALSKMGLDIASDAGKRTRDMILSDYGKSILDAKKVRCERCWMKENNRCNDGCPMNHVPENPLDAAVQYLSKPNNVNLMTFIVMFVVPVYERTTGKKDFMDNLKREFERRWDKTYGRGSTRENRKNVPEYW